MFEGGTHCLSIASIIEAQALAKFYHHHTTPIISPSSFIWMCRNQSMMLLQGTPRLSTLSLSPVGMYSTSIKTDLVPLAEARLAVAVHILPVDLITEKESRGEEERCVIPTTMNRLTPTYYQQNNTSSLHPLNLYLIKVIGGSLYGVCISKLCAVQ
eukprot:scaffold1740_cov150-Skeletonema_dohrnii-CCMP3373.AAC.9